VNEGRSKPGGAEPESSPRRDGAPESAPEERPTGPVQGAKVSPYELFYDLVFVGAILGLSLSFGQTGGFEGLVVAAATFLFAWWIWQETMLFSNRFGDPLGPLAAGSSRRTRALSFGIRIAALFQMLLIVLLALDEPEGLRPDGIDSGFAWVSAGAVASVFALREMGARLRPDLIEEVQRRRVWSVVAIGLMVAAAGTPGVLDEGLWALGLLALVVPGSALIGREEADLPPNALEHVSERLMLFVLIVAGDLFLKIIVYWNTSLTTQFEVVQLVFVSLIVFSFFRIYTAAVVSRPVPDRRFGLELWLALHYVLSFALLIAAGGMVEYVTPKEGVEVSILIAAGLGLAVAVGMVALLTGYAGDHSDHRRARALGAVAALLGVATAVVAYLTPEDWRVGVATLAVIMVGTALSSSLRDEAGDRAEPDA
jgi:low temperature requirement protein LtrA